MKTKPLTFRCPDALMAAIEEMATTQGVSRSEATVQLIRLGLEAQGVVLDCKTTEYSKMADLEELEQRLTVRLNEAIERLREDFSGKLSA